MSEQKSFFRKLMEQYDQLCKDLGVEKGGCRGCVPVVKFDEELDDKKSSEQDK